MDRQALPLVAPFLLFAAFLVGEGYFPDYHYAIYPFKTLAVGALILWYWRKLPSLRPGSWLGSVAVGIISVVAWIGLDPVLVHYAQPLVGRNPFLLYPAGEAWALFGFRVIGIAVCVPIMEELFWRAFLMRYLIEEDFTKVVMGTYRPVSFFVTTALFASVHGVEWPLAVIVGLIYGGWFVWTKNLGNVIVAHGVTNLLLIFYCLWANDWHFLSIISPVSK